MLKRAAAVLACGGPRCYRQLSAAAGDVVDEMIAFSRSSYKEHKMDEAVDVLKSGLGFQQTGRGAGRLYLAQAEIEADCSHWPEVTQLCRRAAAAASDCQPASPDEALGMAEVELAAAVMGTRASLAQHRDAEAFQMAQQSVEVARESFSSAGAEDRRWQGLVLANAIAGTAQHASGDMDAAGDSFDSVMRLADQKNEQQDAPRDRDQMVAAALKAAAAFRLAQGQPAEAESLANRAVAAASAALEAAQASPAGALESPFVLGEAVADAHVISAQVSADKREWDAAEESLAAALAAAEALGADDAAKAHPRVALVLTLLGGVYARTGRVTLAEGLYREAAKTLGLTPGGGADALELKIVHPSVGALLAWRGAQLLTALPGRGTEAAAWARLGRDLYEDAPLGGALAPETALGSLDSLQGKGQRGRGAVLDLMTRRALPRAPPLTEAIP